MLLKYCKFNDSKELQKKPMEVFYKKSVPKNFVKVTGTHLFLSLFFNKVAGQFLRTPF